MNQQERDIIQGIFDRLKAAESQPRDAEAERFIADLQTRQPYAPYVLAQSVYALEQSVNTLSGQLDAAQREISDLKAKAQAPAQSGGFLSGIFGGNTPAATPRPSGPWGQPIQSQQPQPQSGPWGGQQAPAAPRTGGGFLATAATAAVGVAGGMLAANAISSMLGGGNHGHHGNHGNNNQVSQQSASNNNDSFSGSGQSDYGDDDSGYDSGGYDDGGSDA